MPFPDSPRVIYGKTPLAEVACKLRFPPILRIDSELPVRFQEAIRTEYPSYKDVASTNTPFPANFPPELSKMIQGMGMMRQSGAMHEFADSDGWWRVTLTRESLELKATQYRRWEEFRGRLVTLNDTLREVYQPASFVRVGLQYVDIIRRSSLGLQSVPWSELLKPQIAGELSAAEVADQIDSASRQVHVRLDDRDRFVTIKSGIALAEGDKEKCFLIDSEFHTHSRTEISDVLTTLDTFNRLAGRLFRWCIQRRLHEALEPHAVEA